MSFCIQDDGDLLNMYISTVMYTGVWEIFMQNISDYEIAINRPAELRGGGGGGGGGGG